MASFEEQCSFQVSLARLDERMVSTLPYSYQTETYLARFTNKIDITTLLKESFFGRRGVAGSDGGYPMVAMTARILFSLETGSDHFTPYRLGNTHVRSHRANRARRYRFWNPRSDRSVDSRVNFALR